MKKEMKELLEHLQQGDYSTEDVITIMESLKGYGRALVEFHNSSTPEGEALARWNMQDARTAWETTCSDYQLPYYKADKYY